MIKIYVNILYTTYYFYSDIEYIIKCIQYLNKNINISEMDNFVPVSIFIVNDIISGHNVKSLNLEVIIIKYHVYLYICTT